MLELLYTTEILENRKENTLLPSEKCQISKSKCKMFKTSIQKTM